VICLDSHAVIEASAGTGKTHTLVDVVKRLLLECHVPLEHILLVTYTEKATGELKSRLRSELEKLSEEQPVRRPWIQRNLDTFDQANVFTIHGFCQRVLQEYAFENRQNFRAELVDDSDVLETCLREIQRKDWPVKYGERLATLLEFSGLKDLNSGSNWEKAVLGLALAFRPSCGHVLLPSISGEPAFLIQQMEEELRSEHSRLQQIAGLPSSAPLEEHPWWIGFGKLTYRIDHRESRRQNILRPLLHWLADQRSQSSPLVAFQALLLSLRDAGTFKSNGFRLLTDQMGKPAQPQLADFCPGLGDAVEILEKSKENLKESALVHLLKLHTIRDLQDHLQPYKAERSMQSFEDMLTRVDEALDPNRYHHHETLALALRKRYRFAIVDEFQDTDPIQWRIFHRLFVAGRGENKLFVVGDPKQSIFGFRGADVHTYLRAKQTLISEHLARFYELKENWRSDPHLIEPLNRLFEQGKWFDDGSLSFTPVDSAPEEKRPYQIREDNTQVAALNLVDLSSSETLSAARDQMGRFLAGEIQRLLARSDASQALSYIKNGERKSLGAGDICILVAKKAEAKPVAAALTEANIPYTFYKQAGLWQSDEALNLEYILRALARTGDRQAFTKALLTRVFRFRPVDLTQTEETAGNHPAREVFNSWRAFAQDRRWAQLFQSLEQDSGLIVNDLEFADGDRRRANWSYITQFLQETAYAQDLDLIGIVELLGKKRRQPGSEEADLQPIETESPKVKIMTIHASKGLEFPIVFLAGGFTEGKKLDYARYRCTEEGPVIFDLTPEEKAESLAKKEEQDELRRLYYVALTRAIFKLYVPYFLEGQTFPRQGPFFDLVMPAIHKSGVVNLAKPFVQVVKPHDEQRSPLLESATAQNRAAGVKRVLESPTISLPGDLFPQVDREVKNRRIWVNSFSSLHRRYQLVAQEATQYSDQVPRADDDEAELPEVPNPFRGPVFGEMVHDVLEVVDFEHVGKADTVGLLSRETLDLVEQVRQRHWPKMPARLVKDAELEVSCWEQLAGLVWSALHTPLQAVDGPLWQIPKKDRIHELEFQFPCNDRPLPPELGRNEEFITGFMDLVFRRKGQYFLIDWKTNLLPGSYSPAEIRQCMEDSDYTRQYRLYLIALNRWLRQQLGNAFDLQRSFGGVYYLFLRGLNGIDESTGVFFHKPVDEDLRMDLVMGE
jgi:exodeoxyribonuclease V beta subunit